VTIPDSATSIGWDAFGGCNGLTSINIPNSVTSIEDFAFGGCGNLTNVTIGNGITSIEPAAFSECGGLTGIYFTGNAPVLGSSFIYASVFYDDSATVYYLPGTTGWGTTFGGLWSSLWLPQIQTSDGWFGVKNKQFGFNIAWASGEVVVVEAATNLANPIWTPVSTNTLANGTSYFSDPQWSNYPSRFYRLRSP
jgi:hypothetical protein